MQKVIMTIGLVVLIVMSVASCVSNQHSAPNIPQQSAYQPAHPPNWTYGF